MLDIEKDNLCNFGILSDKPGAGKTYVILGLIYLTKNNLSKKTNIIVVPQNILNQWKLSINSMWKI